tara:strand:+ start:663 stop:878 length:216 start_codon:yes stop_codon:yes gene_type:complete
MSPKLRKIFVKILGKNVKINSRSDINNTLGWDSLNHIKIVNEIEKIRKKKFNIKQILEMTSIKSIEKFLKK